MLQTSGVPGSVRLTLFGSVTAGFSFSQTDFGSSSKSTVLPSDLDIFAWPSSPMMRRAGVSRPLGSGKNPGSDSDPAPLALFDTRFFPAGVSNRAFHFRAFSRHRST